MNDVTPVPAQTMAEVLAYWGSYLDFRRQFDRVPGVQAAVVSGGDLAFSHAYGHSDVGAGRPLTERHLFRIASHSKTFTATAVLQLVEAGRLRLDDAAGTHLPELAGSATGSVTVRELLSHSGGITRDSDDGDFWQLAQPFPDRAGLVEILRAAGSAVIDRNERFKYSNIGFGLLGLIVGSAAATPYNDYVFTHIVGRLGLRDLGPELDAARIDEYAVGYSALSYADVRVPIEHVDTRALSPATGFYSTARDLVRYFAAHLPGDERLLGAESQRQMRQALWDTTPDSGERRYGLGLAVDTVGDRTLIGHGGGYPGHITRSLVDPRDRIAVSVLTNAIDGPAETLAKALFLLLDLATSKPRPDGNRVDLERFTGRFAELWGVTDVVDLGGRLHLLDPTKTDPSTDAVPLEIVDGTTLRAAGGSGYGSYGEPVRYDFDTAGRVRSIRGPSGSLLHPIEDFELPQRFTARR